MRLRSRLLSFWRTLTGGARLDADLDDELRAHVDLLTDEKERAGLSPAAARREAVLEVGGVEQVKERVRDARVGIWLDTFWQDARYGARGLRRTPWFTLTAVASLAIGIGLNTAIFSAIEAVLLRPLPYFEPDRVVRITQTASTMPGVPIGIWPAVFEEWQERLTSFKHVGVYGSSHDAVLRDGALVERIAVTRMSSGALAALGVPPLLGRTLQLGDDHPGSRVAVLAHEYWMSRWNGNPAMIGRNVQIDGASYQVVGVMPATFRFYHDPGTEPRAWSDVLLSDPWLFGSRLNRWSWGMGAIGRLKDSVTTEHAASEVAALAASTDYGVPPSADWGTPKLGATVMPYDVTAEDASDRLLLIWGIASLVLLLAAANTANLLLARASARRQELSIRTAIGASRARLVRQLLTESVMLSLLGGAAGLILAFWAAPLIGLVIPEASPYSSPMRRLNEAGVNWLVLGFMIAVALLTGVAFGVAPAWRASRSAQSTMLLPSGRTTDTTATVRTRTALLVAQLALSLVLLAGAGLMMTTLSHLWFRPHGFDSDGVTTFVVRLPRTLPYVADLGLRPERPVNPSPPANAPLVRHWAPTPGLNSVRQRLVNRLRAIPGVSAATVATGMPMVGASARSFMLANRPAPTDEQRAQMQAITVRALPGYFDTLGMRVLAGRGIELSDQLASRRVAVINRHMARTYWPHESLALGDWIAIEDDRLPYEVVGIVNDARFWMWHGELAKQIYASQVYTPFSLDATSEYPGWQVQQALLQNVAVRVAPGHEVPIDAIRQAVADVAEGTPIEQVRSMTTAMMDSAGNTVGMTLLLSSAATIALSLAAIGIFGIVTFTVTQRTREIGIRVALGASRSAIMRLVLSGAAWLGLAGVGLGVVASLWLTRFIAGQLFPGFSAVDPPVLGVVACLLATIVLLASWLPARRAAAVDPVVALRAE